MGEDKLRVESGERRAESVTLAAEEGASLSSGSLKLYALPYGCVELYNYDPLNQRAAVGIMVAKEFRRQGYALAMLQKLEELFSVQCATQDSGSQLNNEHLTLNTGIHCLYADIAVNNSASIALFKKAGYTECGHFKEWLAVDGKYIDAIRMQLILS